MQKRNFIFGGLAGLLFMVFTAVNVTVSQSYLKNTGKTGLSLKELTAKANTGGEFYCVDDIYGGICTSLYGSDCDLPSYSCYLARK